MHREQSRRRVDATLALSNWRGALCNRRFAHFALTLWLAAAALSPALAANRKVLPGHVPSAVARMQPTGRVPSNQVIRLALGLPLREPQALDALLTELYRPGSPNYRRYLTPQEFTERFGPSEADYQVLMQFARTNGMTIAATHSNRLLLDVTAPAAAIEKAFQLRLHTYPHPTEARNFYAPDVDPSVAANVAIIDISGLSDFSRPEPKWRLPNATGAEAGATPRTGSAADGSYLGYDFRAAYLPGISLTGSGQMVGLVQFDGFYTNDIVAYENLAGLPLVPLEPVLVGDYDGVPTTGPNSGNVEVSLDIEMAISMAPGLDRVVIFETSPSGLPNDVLNAMVARSEIKQFGCSWGWSGGPSVTTDNIFKQMAAQGQSFFAASGDSDAYTVGSPSSNEVDDPWQAGAPSSSPYITIVGGTTLTTTGPGGAWVSEKVWNWGSSGSSGGVSSYYLIPSWQSALDFSTNGGSAVYRNIPDVALTADNVYVTYGNGAHTKLGGTSCATPLWAGLAALLNQQAAELSAPSVGFLNPAIYSVALSTNYAACFHDTVLGNNVWSDSTNRYYAVPGYDLCTGWGTPKGAALIAALAPTGEPFRVLPAVGFNARGPVGGPFKAASGTFTLTNSGSNAISWSVINTSLWLAASSTNGAFMPGASLQVNVTLTTNASALPPGKYNASLVFSNVSRATSQTIDFSLQVERSLVLNGGFETGDFSDWTLVGQTYVGTYIYNSVETDTSMPGVVHSGAYGAFLGDTQLATLSQDLSTSSGRSYWLSCWFENLQTGGEQIFQVRWITGATTNLLYALTNPPAFNWSNLNFLVTAAGTNSTLQFAAENGTNFFGLDDVDLLPMGVVGFSVVSPVTGSLKLGWPTTTGLVYQVQYRTNLLQTNWLNLGAATLAADSNLSILDTNALISSPRRFYRLKVSP